MSEISDIPKLKFIDSNHEQREMSIKVIPEKGWWLEEGKFWKNVERFDVHKRWRCVEHIVDKENQKVVVKLKLMDHTQQQKRVDKVAKKVLEKNKDVLVASMMKTVIKGVYQNKHDIEDFVQHAKRYPNNEARDKYVAKLNVEDRIKNKKEKIERLKNQIESDTQLLKELNEEDAKWLAKEH